jgi:hypothetical protein
MPAALKIRMTGDWKRAVSDMGQARARMAMAIDKAVAQEAHEVRKEIIQGIRKQAPAGHRFQALSKLALAIRKARGFRGSKALIRTAALINSIAVKRAGKGRYFVGVLRGGKSRDGTSLTHIAAIHEKGSTHVVRVTPKMRRFLMLMLRKAGILGRRKKKGFASTVQKRVMVVRIPARPFMQPVIDKVAKDPAAIRRRLGQRMAKLLGYTLGK